MGVFKETDGLYDFGEQLFKHEGYCLWDGDEDGYEFMQNELLYWPSSCTKMYLTDYYGNTLYLDIKPGGEGNITYGMYSDDECSSESDFTWAEYVIKYYKRYYYSEQDGQEAAEEFTGRFDTWNTMMNSYKICQPCRAYNLNRNEDESGSSDGSEDHGDDEAEEDGNGSEEQWGYNCYDDAGYRNCNQVSDTHPSCSLVILNIIANVSRLVLQI